MIGFSDGTARMVLVTRHGSNSGMEAESYDDYFVVAAHAIRAGVMRGEHAVRLIKLLEEEHLDKFVKISPKLNSDALINEDDKRNAKADL